MVQPVIVWFRDDLRLASHAPLRAAIESGQPVIPVYVLDTSGPFPLGGAARWWLHGSLTALAAGLSARGAGLVTRRGAAETVIPALVEETAATDVFTGAMTDPAARAADRAVASALAPLGRRLDRRLNATLFRPDRVKTQAGGSFSVFTPFARACRALPPPASPWSAPASVPSAALPASDDPNDWGLLPRRPDWAGGLRESWTPGEAGARARLDRFVSETVSGYATRRDVPALAATSRLSPHLRFGEIAPGDAWHAIEALPESQDSRKFLDELLWREFSHHLLWHNPKMPDEPLRPEFAAMRWRDDPAALAAWQRGRTGVPIVDAGMRELWHTGWTHNRVRMIVASFLIKHLLLDWRHGERWFRDTLVDADLANNAAGWQWVAGCGADAAPFFRIFNPVLQGKKFDPDGEYVRRWVPELRAVPARHVHAPWEGGGPQPIVDLAAGRARALAAFGAMRGG